VSWESPTARPDFRATSSEREIVLVPWRPELIRRCGPSNELLRFRGAGVVVADLTIIRDPGGYELIVSELAPPSDGKLGAALADWAASLGYRRIWCGGDLIELDRSLDATGGAVRTRCRACRSEWWDDSPEFWSMSHALGVFPIWCPLCGGFLPQWSVARLHEDHLIQQIGKRS
jgi:hypothetical protein